MRAIRTRGSGLIAIWLMFDLARVAAGQALPTPSPPPPELPPTAGVPTTENRPQAIPPAPLAASLGPDAVKWLPIDLPTAMKLANVRTLDIAAAIAGIEQARGLQTQARALLIPNLNGGVGYYRHDGSNQNLFVGTTFRKSSNSLLVGGGPTLNVGLTDAIFAPLAAKRVVAARQADLQAARNNSVLGVAQAYFNLQGARGRLSGTELSLIKAQELVRLVDGLAPGLVPSLEINRAQAELQSLKQDLENNRRDWRVASTQLAQVLLLEMSAVLEPVEPPFLQLILIPPGQDIDSLLGVAIANRPELASQRNLLATAEMILRREKYRPLLPNLIATTPQTAGAGQLAAGEFYGAVNGQKFGPGSSRDDFSLAATWQLQNGGLGYKGVVKQRKAERDMASIELTRTVYQVKADVSIALAQLQTSRARIPEAEEGLRQATESAEKNFIGLRQTSRTSGQLLQLVVRPQEVVASIIALNTSYQQYFSAINDGNLAQFELYRALGQPAQWVAANLKSANSATTPIPKP